MRGNKRMYWFYEIKNNLNNKKYVGLTSNIKRREIRHFTDLRTQRHHNSFLQEEFNLFGREAFIFSVLDCCDCDSAIASEKEIAWIAKEDSFHNGYNQNPGGLGGHTCASNGGSHLLQTDIYSINSVLEFASRPGAVLADIFGVTATTISRIKKGESRYLYSCEYKNFPLEKRKEIFQDFCKATGFLIKKANKTILLSQRKLSVFQAECVFANDEYGRIIPLNRLARYFGVQSYVLSSILSHKGYQDCFYSYQEKTKNEKDEMASFLREEEQKHSRIAGTSLRSTNHNISEKKV